MAIHLPVAFLFVVSHGGYHDGQVEFVLKGDGEELFKSPLMTKKDEPKAVTADIQGITILTLRVNRGPKGGTGDDAVWVNAKVSR